MRRSERLFLKEGAVPGVILKEEKTEEEEEYAVTKRGIKRGIKRVKKEEEEGRKPAAKKIKVEESITSTSKGEVVKVKKEEVTRGSNTKKKVKVEATTSDGEVVKVKKEEVKQGSNTKKKVKVEVQKGSPFPNFSRPTPEEGKWACNALAKLHGMPKQPSKNNGKGAAADCGEVPDVIQAVVRTILSQNTTQENGSRAYKSMVAKFGACNWEAIHKATREEVSKSIECGGLGPKKAKYIKEMLEAIHEKYGKFSLDHMHQLSDAEVTKELTQFNGVGAKTASCVLLFCLKRSSFAVDTHIFRITKKLGWIPKEATREQAFAHLDQHLPDEIKYALHVLFIAHGKRCKNCAANGKPRMKDEKLEVGECPLRGRMVSLKDEKGKKKKKSAKGKKDEPEDEEEEEDEDEEEEENEEEEEITKEYVAETVSLEIEGTG